MDGSFNEEGVVFRKLGGIESGLSYTLFGWGQEMTNHVVSTLTVYNSGSCDSNFPQVFCSTFTVANARSCDAGLGSPLIAVDDSMAGFLISNAKMCTISGDKFVLSFISLEGFQEWIEKTSGAQKNVKISLMMIFVAFVTSKLFL